MLYNTPVHGESQISYIKFNSAREQKRNAEEYQNGYRKQIKKNTKDEMTIRKSQLTFYLNRIRWEKTKNSDNETKMLIESRLSNNKHRTIRPWNPQRAFVTIIREILIYKRKENKTNQSEGV